MSLIAELDSVAAAVSAVLPDIDIKYSVPNDPKSGHFIIRTQRNELTAESRTIFRIERLYQLLYYAEHSEIALDQIDKLSRHFMAGTTLIPINDGSLRYIRIGSFSFSDPVENESGLKVIIAMMPTELRQARDQATFEKIASIHARIN